MFSVLLFGIMFPPRSKDHLTKIMCFYHVVFLQKTALSARLVVSPSREDALSPHYFVKLALLVSCRAVQHDHLEGKSAAQSSEPHIATPFYSL